VDGVDPEAPGADAEREQGRDGDKKNMETFERHPSE